MPNIGDTAPEFSLYDADKKMRNLSEFLVKGRRTILAFYPGAFTGVCDKEMCTFRDMYGELEKLNGMLVGVSVDAPFAQKAFAKEYNLTFPLLCDFERKTVPEIRSGVEEPRWGRRIRLGQSRHIRTG